MASDNDYSNPSYLGSGVSIADNFIVSSDMIFYQIVFWGFYDPGNTPPATDYFTVIIHQDEEGFPGTVVYSESGIVPTERIDTGLDILSYEEYRFTLDLSIAPILSAGIYWVEIFNDTPTTTSNFYWETGNLDALNGILGSAFHNNLIPWTNSGLSSVDLAIEFNGVPSTPVPTLSEWGIVMLSMLLGCVALRCLRNQRST